MPSVLRPAALEEEALNGTIETDAVSELDDVLNTDFGAGFNLADELQQHG
jgi:hypothetical protein